MTGATEFPSQLGQTPEENLRRQQDFSRVILDSAQGLICCMDVEGRIVLFNSACQKLTGYTEDEVIGRYYWDAVIPPGEAENRRQRFAKLKEGYISGGVESIWLTKQRDERIISWQTSILRESDGRIAGVVATGLDVTDRRKAERALAREQSFIRALLDELPDGLVACDETGNLKFFNRRAVEFHGRPPSPVPPQAWAEQFHWRHHDGRTLRSDEVPLFRALNGEHVRDAEIVIAPEGRNPRYMLCSGDPLKDADGNRLGALLQMHDDTERRAAEKFLRRSERRLREQNQQLEFLFAMARDLTQTLNRAGLAALLNTAVSGIAQLLRTDVCRILLTDANGRLATAHESGSQFGTYELSAPLESASGGFGLLVVSQAAERRWKEPERKWLTAAADLIGNAFERVNLVEELARRADDLEVQKDRALEASRAKTRFLANMSHEIRTPLNGVLGLVQLLVRAGDIPAERLQTLRMVYDCGSHLLDLVNDILDLSRIESGRMEFNDGPVDLRLLLQELVNVFSASAREKGLTLTVEVADSCPQLIVTDGRRLRQVLFNLVGNSVKFTERGQVRVAVGRDADFVLFGVTDTGPGIDPETMKTLFQPFERGAADSATPGTGLGLAISSRLAEGLGGRIEAESKLGAGSRFTVRIPVRQAEATLPAEELKPAPAEDWADPSRFTPSFVASLERELVPALLSGDPEEIGAVLVNLRGPDALAYEVQFLEEVDARVKRFELGMLYPLAERIRTWRAQ